MHEWFPVVIVVSALCFLGAYGLEKRKPWAWYAGWWVGFFTAGGVAYFSMAVMFQAETTLQFVSGLIFTLGGGAVWTFWAVWWATHREEFIKPQAP